MTSARLPPSRSSYQQRRPSAGKTRAGIRRSSSGRCRSSPFSIMIRRGKCTAGTRSGSYTNRISSFDQRLISSTPSSLGSCNLSSPSSVCPATASSIDILLRGGLVWLSGRLLCPVKGEKVGLGSSRRATNSRVAARRVWDRSHLLTSTLSLLIASDTPGALRWKPPSILPSDPVRFGSKTRSTRRQTRKTSPSDGPVVKAVRAVRR